MKAFIHVFILEFHDIGPLGVVTAKPLGLQVTEFLHFLIKSPKAPDILFLYSSIFSFALCLIFSKSSLLGFNTADSPSIASWAAFAASFASFTAVSLSPFLSASFALSACSLAFWAAFAAFSAAFSFSAILEPPLRFAFDTAFFAFSAAWLAFDAASSAKSTGVFSMVSWLHPKFGSPDISWLFDDSFSFLPGFPWAFLFEVSAPAFSACFLASSAYSFALSACSFAPLASPFFSASLALSASSWAFFAASSAFFAASDFSPASELPSFFALSAASFAALALPFALSAASCASWPALPPPLTFLPSFWILFLSSSLFLEIICSCTIYYTVEYDALFIITVLIIAACLGGNFCCISPLYTLIYGIEVGPQMYALAGNVMGIAQFCGPILVKLFLYSKKDYLITFLIGGTFCVCKIAVLLFFDDTEKIEIDLEEKIDKEVNDLNINERLTVEENEKNKN